MNRHAAGVFAACLVPRLAALFLTGPPAPNFYWRISSSLLASGTFALDGATTGAYEPLYPLFLATTRALTGDRFVLVMLIQALLASGGGVLLFSLTARATGRRRAALAAALCYAVYPYYVRQSVAPIELTLSVCLLIGAAWEFGRLPQARSTAWLGIWLGLLVLLRVMFAPLGLALLALVAIRRGWRDAALAAAVSLALVGPWLGLSRVTDRPAMPSRIGENLYVSTCAPAADVMPRYDLDLLVRHAHDAVGANLIAAAVPDALAERAVDDTLFARALACAREHPGTVLWLKVRNLGYVFWPALLPVHARTPRPAIVLDGDRAQVIGAVARPAWEAVPHFVAHAAISLAALVGLWRRKSRLGCDAHLLVMLANTAFVYAVFFPTTRLVAPTAFVLMYYAGAGVTATTAAARRPR